MDGYTIVLCYTRGEIIDCEFGVCYNHSPKKGVSINSMTTFNELETKLCHALNINCTYTELNMVFRYLIPFPNGRGAVNYVPLPEDRDISGLRLRLTWLIEHFPALAPNADVESV